MNKIKVNLSSKYFTESQHIETIEEMLADLIQKHPSVLTSTETNQAFFNQVLLCQCDQQATKLDSHGVEAPNTIEGLYFYAFFSLHTIFKKNEKSNFSTDIMEKYLGIRKTGACPLRITKIGPSEYNATDCKAVCKCGTNKTKH